MKNITGIKRGQYIQGLENTETSHSHKDSRVLSIVSIIDMLRSQGQRQ